MKLTAVILVILIALFVNWEYVLPNSKVIDKQGINGFQMKKDMKHMAVKATSPEHSISPDCLKPDVITICDYR